LEELEELKAKQDRPSTCMTKERVEVLEKGEAFPRLVV
jgi:hypothetical protein